MKKPGLFCLIQALVMFVFMALFLPAVSLRADGADITFGTAEEISDDNVYLELGGRLPTDIYSFEMNINYNDAAFVLEGCTGADYDGFAISCEKTEPGICRILGKSNGGFIPQGERLLVTLHLRAKAAGFSTLALLNSFFYDRRGQQVPGTILRYYSLNTQDAMDRLTSTTPAPVTEASTALETVIITSPSGSASVAVLQTSAAGAETLPALSTTAETSVTETKTLSAAASTDLTMKVPTALSGSDKMERQGFTEQTQKILFGVAAALLLVILVIIVKMISNRQRH